MPMEFDPVALGQRIKAARAGRPVAPIAASVGLEPPSWSRYEHGKIRGISVEALFRMAGAMGVHPSKLIGEKAQDVLDLDGDVDQVVEELVRQTESDREAVLKQLIIDALRARGYDVGPTDYGRPVKLVEFPEVRLPVEALAAAGTNRYPQWTQFYEDVSLPKVVAERAQMKGYKVIRVVGDSMSPTYEDGDMVFVQPMTDIGKLEELDVVVFWIDGETMVKRFRHDGYSKRWILSPDNPSHPPLVPPNWDRLLEYRWCLVGVVRELAKRVSREEGAKKT
ncbi:MAG: hypothetical protein L6R30_26695 [Thermoanaerobaculia bacterium]|nr:hypothetical protein [Thermoanaerobaculia bacterium]